MELMDLRRGLMMGMASASKVQNGTFVGDGTNAIAIPCPFEPDIINVWCDDLKTNPGVSSGCLISCFIVRDFGYNTFRYTNATSGQAAGGAIRNPSIRYGDGVYTFYSQSDVAAFYPLSGYTYKYSLTKL